MPANARPPANVSTNPTKKIDELLLQVQQESRVGYKFVLGRGIVKS
ncbi:MAG: hypothetical protein LBU14_00435 [Candidatus Peribacteria bacterium]|jgi:hypothetical protein|nr:hypothetical protein [Candidatus Peribacteria bacterium]